MTGYHVYYQTKDDGEFEAINYLVQLASIKFWKKNYGSVKLYCNQRYLDSISKYGLDEEYDEINTQFLETNPYKEYSNKFWSFCKIYLANKLAREETRFCIFDTDLWISEPNLISNETDFVFYHQEAIAEYDPFNVYPDPINWIDDVNYNWNINPVNCAIVCFNSNFKELITKWFEISSKIIEQTHSKQFNFVNEDCSTMFIEQRLLPVLIDDLNLTKSEILKSVYQPHIGGDIDSNGIEWVPPLDSNIETAQIANAIKHSWGLKKYYDNKFTRTLVLDVVVNSLNQLGEFDARYEKLFAECETIYNLD